MRKQEAKGSFPPPPLDLDHYPIIADPDGSYTGLVRSLDEKPVQDADDL